MQRLDSLYADSVNHSSGIEVKRSAPAAARAAAANLRAFQGSGRVLATWKGGSLTLGDFTRWVEAFPPQTRMAVAQAPDTSLSQFIQTVVRNEILIRSAQARGITLTAADRDTIRAYFRADLDTMEARLGVAPESLAADTSARHGRAEAAAHAADRYFTGLVSMPSAHPFFELPPFLSDVLRSRAVWDVSQAGIDRALEKANEIRGPTTPRAATPPMSPAPGGPPVGTPAAPAAPAPGKRPAR
jgi:hypothetical protein